MTLNNFNAIKRVACCVYNGPGATVGAASHAHDEGLAREAHLVEQSVHTGVEVGHTALGFSLGQGCRHSLGPGWKIHMLMLTVMRYHSWQYQLLATSFFV